MCLIDLMPLQRWQCLRILAARVVNSFFPLRFFPLRYARVFAIANPSVVCNVGAPYSGSLTFRQYFFTAVYLGHPLTSVQNFTEIVPGEPLRRVR